MPEPLLLWAPCYLVLKESERPLTVLICRSRPKVEGQLLAASGRGRHGYWRRPTTPPTDSA